MILDEINYAVNYGMVNLVDVLKMVHSKPPSMYLVLTRRYKLAGMEDLITEMREIKHPYNLGISAQKGIEY